MVTNKKKSINVKLYVIYGLVITLLIILIGAVVITQNADIQDSRFTSTDSWEMTITHQPVQPTFGCANFIPVIIIIIGIISMIVGWFVYKDEEEDDNDDL